MLRLKGLHKERGVAWHKEVVEENYQDSNNGKSPSSKFESEDDGEKGEKNIKQKEKGLDIQDPKALLTSLQTWFQTCCLRIRRRLKRQLRIRGLLNSINSSLIKVIPLGYTTIAWEMGTSEGFWCQRGEGVDFPREDHASRA